MNELKEFKENMKVVIIVQARMGSTRLPGKVMKEVMGKSLLEYLLERLKRVQRADDICVATTVKSQEQPILDLCESLSVKTFRGSEDNVLERYFMAAQEMQADAIVRVTSDCPLIDPGEIDKLIEQYYLEKYDFISDVPGRSYPLGMGSEIFSFEALDKAHKNAKTAPEREHVTPYLYWNPQIFRLGACPYGNKKNQKDHRWTVDAPEDFQLVSKIIENLYPRNPEFSIEDIFNLIEKNPKWKKINEHVIQKTAKA